MLAKSARLSRADFSDIAGKRGFLAQGKLFSLKVSPLAGRLKFAVVVSAKVAKLSVGRHLVKRRATEAIHKFEIRADSKACILYAKSPAVTASYREIENEVKTLLQGAGVIE